MFLLKSLKLEQTKKSLGIYHRSYAQLDVMRTELGNYKAVKDRCIFSLHLYLGLYGVLVLLCFDQMFHSPFDLGKLVPLVFSMSTWPQKGIPGSTQDNLFKHHYDLTMVSLSRLEFSWPSNVLAFRQLLAHGPILCVIGRQSLYNIHMTT